MQDEDDVTLALAAQKPAVAVGAHGEFHLLFRIAALTRTIHLVQGTYLLASRLRVDCTLRRGIILVSDHAGPDLLDERGLRGVVCSRRGLQVKRRIVRSFKKPSQKRLLHVGYVHQSQPSVIKNRTKTKLITATIVGAALE
ncbi:hypothetical protein [Agrobacterium pusense]|uniref:hypothetical protein n=1 Tax=Agrobacterium pusense TaxID=648995 RepID=UPI0013AF0DFF|nr:hypothetical protein [Agrobacterium pusense]MBP2614117.1 hypothetical protein [Agrobacterium pusense]